MGKIIDINKLKQIQPTKRIRPVDLNLNQAITGLGIDKNEKNLGDMKNKSAVARINEMYRSVLTKYALDGIENSEANTYFQNILLTLKSNIDLTYALEYVKIYDADGNRMTTEALMDTENANATFKKADTTKTELIILDNTDGDALDNFTSYENYTGFIFWGDFMYPLATEFETVNRQIFLIIINKFLEWTKTSGVTFPLEMNPENISNTLEYINRFAYSSNLNDNLVSLTDDLKSVEDKLSGWFRTLGLSMNTENSIWQTIPNARTRLNLNSDSWYDEKSIYNNDGSVTINSDLIEGDDDTTNADDISKIRLKLLLTINSSYSQDVDVYLTGLETVSVITFSLTPGLNNIEVVSGEHSIVNGNSFFIDLEPISATVPSTGGFEILEDYRNSAIYQVKKPVVELKTSNDITVTGAEESLHNMNLVNINSGTTISEVHQADNNINTNRLLHKTDEAFGGVLGKIDDNIDAINIIDGKLNNNTEAINKKVSKYDSSYTNPSDPADHHKPMEAIVFISRDDYQSLVDAGHDFVNDSNAYFVESV